MLKEILKETMKIKPLTFRDFMELSLYHNDYGYYTQKVNLGKEGDFYTAPILTKSFGYTLAKYANNLSNNYGIKLKLLEYGAGTGKMAQDILDWFFSQKLFPDYYIVEISPHLQKLQAKNLQNYQSQVYHLDSLPENFSGIILANEVVDAFPVHRVILQKGALRELYVGINEDGALFEYPGELSSSEIATYLKEANIYPVEGQILEINLAALNWLSNLYHNLSHGAVIIIDYGYNTEELYHPFRKEGTLTSFARHRQQNPLKNPGKQDITSHVDFGMLRKKAKELGFQEIEFVSQGNFLINAGILELIKQENLTQTLESYQETLKIKKLILPPMGEVFKVLVLIKK